LETARLDMLQVSLWGRAMAGDVAAVAQARRIIETRIRLLGLFPGASGRWELSHGRLRVPAGDRASSGIPAEQRVTVRCMPCVAQTPTRAFRSQNA